MENAVRAHGIECIEEQVDKRLFKLIRVSTHGIGRGMERAEQFYLSAFEMVLNEVERLIKHLMEMNDAERRPGWTAKAQHLAHDRIDTLHLTSDDVGQGGILILGDEQFDECLDGDEGVLHLVRHAGGERADAGEAIHLPEILFQMTGRSDVVQRYDNAGDRTTG